MRVLELFSGTGSVGKVARELGYEVVSLDINGKADINIDIMEWDYSTYPVGYFDIIWASPECKVFSQLQYTNIGRKWKDKADLQEARDANCIYIQKTIEIIEYLSPTYYFVENPLSSTIFNYIPDEYGDKYVIVDYCYFGYRYKKPTKILTNKKLENKRCSCKKHSMRLGVSSNAYMLKSKCTIKDNTTLNEKYSIPRELILYLLS